MKLSRRLAPLLLCTFLGCGEGPAPSLAAGAASDEPVRDDGWYPHEGGLLQYRVQIRFGEELPNKRPSGAMPDDWEFGRVSAVSTDSEGNVYVFQRGTRADPIVVFDREGTRMLRSWGRGMFTRPHAIRVDPEDNVWITDAGDHRVMKFSKEGELLLELGVRGEPGNTPRHFNRPADLAFAPSGDIYVAEQGEDEEAMGFGDARVVRLASDGTYLGSWGSPGTGPGEFHFLHAIAVDSRGRVYVSDRENNRVQIFDAEGARLGEWTHLGSTMSLVITPDDELWMLNHRDNVQIMTYDALAGRIMRVDLESGRILGSLETPGHWLDVSPSGDLYVGSITGNVFRFYPGWLSDEGQGYTPVPAAPAAGARTGALAPAGNRMIDLLEAGRPVFGLTSGEMTPEGGRRMAENRATDYVWYSLETGPFDMPAMEAYIAGMAAAWGDGDLPPFMLRIPPIRDGRERALDHVRQGLASGVKAIAFPHVESAEDVRFIAEAIGDRLWPINPRGDVLAVVMIEDRAAVESVREIVGAPGVGVVFPGPADLRRAYDGDEDAVEAAIQAILAACLELDVPCAMTATVDDVAQRLEQGFRFFVLSQPEVLAAGRAAAGR
jgi:DNA-binding beta-propeller fold protein YncE